MPPILPYVVSGIVRDVDNTLANGAQVSIVNLYNGKALGAATNTAGEYTIDLANLGEDTADNIPLAITAFKTGQPFKFAQAQARTNTTKGSTEQDLTLTAALPILPQTIPIQDAMTLEHHPVYSAKMVVQREKIPLDTLNNNESMALTFDSSNNPTVIKKTIKGITYTKTLTWDSSNNPLTISSWS